MRNNFVNVLFFDMMKNLGMYPDLDGLLIFSAVIQVKNSFKYRGTVFVSSWQVAAVARGRAKMERDAESWGEGWALNKEGSWC